MPTYAMKLLFLLLIFSVLIPNVYAMTRADIESIEAQILSKEKQIPALDNKISEQKIVIVNRESAADQKREELRDVKDRMGQSWDALLSVERIEKEYQDSLKSLQQAKDLLISLLNEKSQLILDVKTLNSELVTGKKEIKQTKFDVSKITKLIGVQLSNSCIDMIKNNIPNNPCPTYEELESLDTSRREYSGQFADDNGFYHRMAPKFINSWRIYDSDPTPRIIVDPPQGMAERMRMITINPNFSVYFTEGDQKLDEGIRTWHEGRYIDNCKQAYIGTNDWKRILPDTIATLHNNCSHTSLDELRQETMPFTELPLGETQYWKDKVWLEDAKERCKGRCFEY